VVGALDPVVLEAARSGRAAGPSGPSPGAFTVVGPRAPRVACRSFSIIRAVRSSLSRPGAVQVLVGAPAAPAARDERGGRRGHEAGRCRCRGAFIGFLSAIGVAPIFWSAS